MRTLSDVAAARKTTVDILVIDAIESTGSVLRAAAALEVAPNSISYHLQKRGLRVERRIIARVVPVVPVDRTSDFRAGAESGSV